MEIIAGYNFGSHLYGTNTETSDIDRKFIFIPSAEEILTQKAPGVINNSRHKSPGEKNNLKDVDEEFISLHKYLDLLVQGQTMALDMFFATPFYTDDPYGVLLYLKDNKDKLLSKKATSFVGYCRTQANKYGIKGSRVSAARNALSLFISLAENYKLKDYASMGFYENLVSLNPEHIKFTEVIQNNGEPLPHLEVCNRKLPYSITVKEAKNILSRIVNEYGERALQAERNEGIDWKALSHAVRVGYEAIELMAFGSITFPRPERKRLLDIKKGLVPYKDVAAEIESILVCVEQASLNSILPDQPDKIFVDKVVESVYRQKVIKSIELIW